MPKKGLLAHENKGAQKDRDDQMENQDINRLFKTMRS